VNESLLASTGEQESTVINAYDIALTTHNPPSDHQIHYQIIAITQTQGNMLHHKVWGVEENAILKKLEEKDKLTDIISITVCIVF